MNSETTQDWGEVLVRLFGQDMTWKLFNRDHLAAALYANPSLNTLRQAFTEMWSSGFSLDKWIGVFRALGNTFDYLVHGEIYKGNLSLRRTFGLGERITRTSTIAGVPLVVIVNGAVDVDLDTGVNVSAPWFGAGIVVDSNLQTGYML